MVAALYMQKTCSLWALGLPRNREISNHHILNYIIGIHSLKIFWIFFAARLEQPMGFPIAMFVHWRVPSGIQTWQRKVHLSVRQVYNHLSSVCVLDEFSWMHMFHCQVWLAAWICLKIGYHCVSLQIWSFIITFSHYITNIYNIYITVYIYSFIYIHVYIYIQVCV